MSPILILMLLNSLFKIDPILFACLILSYAIIYHPTIIEKRLLYKKTIRESDFFKNYIPFWNMQYYSEAFM